MAAWNVLAEILGDAERGGVGAPVAWRGPSWFFCLKEKGDSRSSNGR